MGLLDEYLERNRTVSAKRMIDEAHHFAGWIHAWADGRGRGTPIPLESIFWDGSRKVAEDWENDYARELAVRYRL